MAGPIPFSGTASSTNWTSEAPCHHQPDADTHQISRDQGSRLADECAAYSEYAPTAHHGFALKITGTPRPQAEERHTAITSTASASAPPPTLAFAKSSYKGNTQGNQASSTVNPGLLDLLGTKPPGAVAIDIGFGRGRVADTDCDRQPSKSFLRQTRPQGQSTSSQPSSTSSSFSSCSSSFNKNGNSGIVVPTPTPQTARSYYNNRKEQSQRQQGRSHLPSASSPVSPRLSKKSGTASSPQHRQRPLHQQHHFSGAESNTPSNTNSLRLVRSVDTNAQTPQVDVTDTSVPASLYRTVSATDDPLSSSGRPVSLIPEEHTDLNKFDFGFGTDGGGGAIVKKTNQSASSGTITSPTTLRHNTPRHLTSSTQGPISNNTASVPTSSYPPLSPSSISNNIPLPFGGADPFSSGGAFTDERSRPRSRSRSSSQGRPQSSRSVKDLSFPAPAKTGLSHKLSLQNMTLFKRTTSDAVDRPVPKWKQRSWMGVSSSDSAPIAIKNGGNLTTSGKPWSSNTKPYNSDYSTNSSSRSNTPPSPSHNTMASTNGMAATVPYTQDFLDRKKDRATTGFSLRDKIAFHGGDKKADASRTRAKSFEGEPAESGTDPTLTYNPWGIAPEAGTGVKARRLSLSLPDDFNIEITELDKLYEYQNNKRFNFGRHGSRLGKGATSKVRVVSRKGISDELYAVKEFRAKNREETKAEFEKKIKSEYTLSKSLHHPNIVETFQLCTHAGLFNHVMEYCTEGDLFELVKNKYLTKPGRETDRLCLFKQLCQGVNYLHSNGVAHRDIKLENLLLTKDSKLKITDFGVSEVFSGIHPGIREAGGQCGRDMGPVRLCKPGVCGSAPYISPEVLEKKGEYDPRLLDAWSCGIILITFFFGGTLWWNAEAKPDEKTNYTDLVKAWDKFNAKKAANNDLDKDEYPRMELFERGIRHVAARRVLLRLLNPNPASRLTIAEVASSRWLKNIECCQLESYDEPSRCIDATKKNALLTTNGKIYCHNHLPPRATGGKGLPPMPGQDGY